MSISKVGVRNALKPEEFVKITWVDKILPDAFTILRYLSITDYSVVQSKDYEHLIPVDLLRGVDFSKSKYVTLVGVVISGVWTIPENCAGGATVALVDTRMSLVSEGTICKFSVSAASRDFTVKLIPNYYVTAADAASKPWSLFVRISGVRIKDGFSPLTLEIASLVATTNSILKKGLRVSVLESVVGSDASVSLDTLSEKVQPFFDSVPITASVVSRDRSYVSKSRPPVRNGPGRRKSKGMSEAESFSDGGASEPLSS
uniref:Movement protein n=1 Tax=Cucumber fruit mottle mosaic virus TaxID=146499 RepID=A0A899J717_9VIRU|nr:movement protein [Cucumber fruit mottle mosaic virus]